MSGNILGPQSISVEEVRFDYKEVYTEIKSWPTMECYANNSKMIMSRFSE